VEKTASIPYARVVDLVRAPSVEPAEDPHNPSASGASMKRRDFFRAGAAVGVAGIGRFGAFPELRELEASALIRRQAAGDVKLSSNENPLGLAPVARQAVVDRIPFGNRYPGGYRGELTELLAARHGVSQENLVLGNGSTEILQMIVQAATSPNATLVLADPTFEDVSRYQRPHSYVMEPVPLGNGYVHDIQQMRDVTRKRGRPSVVYICNPNNPTGTLTPSRDVDAWIEEAPETVLFAVDEAYFEYVDHPDYWSAAKWIDSKPNVVVVRTFSKIFGMAGMRLGYALAHPSTAGRLSEFMGSNNANQLAIAAAIASLKDEELVGRSRAVNDAAKQVTHSCLEDLDLEYLPSHTNFLMHRISGDLGTYISRMRQAGIRVGRPFPPMLTYNRLSFGLPEEMGRWAEVLRDFRGKGWV
jgi:histidinol-phosphate aminotransferase